MTSGSWIDKSAFLIQVSPEFNIETDILNRAVLNHTDSLSTFAFSSKIGYFSVRFRRDIPH